MTRLPILILGAGVAGAMAATPALAEGRYAPRPPVILSPDIAEPWTMQLRPAYRDVTGPVVYAPVRAAEPRPSRYAPPAVAGRPDDPTVQRIASVAPPTSGRSGEEVDPKFLPAVVPWDGKQAPGTIVIDTSARYLYLVEAGGKARRYGVGVGRPGFLWTGTHTVTRKAEWPDWVPPPEMLKRKPELPRHMAGGPDNPLGARALYLGSTLYRIHGSNEPWTIGRAVSSGCIRMRNQDVTDLYARVGVGTRVVVL